MPPINPSPLRPALCTSFTHSSTNSSTSARSTSTSSSSSQHRTRITPTVRVVFPSPTDLATVLEPEVALAGDRHRISEHNREEGRPWFELGSCPTCDKALVWVKGGGCEVVTATATV